MKKILSPRWGKGMERGIHTAAEFRNGGEVLTDGKAGMKRNPSSPKKKPNGSPVSIEKRGRRAQVSGRLRQKENKKSGFEGMSMEG